MEVVINTEISIESEMGGIKKQLGKTETTFTKIEFDKFNLFFRSIPNVISYDNVKIKNTGTTCIYFKWQKYVRPFILPDKKSDGIDRFFCHYSDSKLFPDEEKEFVFSFFSEKNGVFAEDWMLITSPPIKNMTLIVHLNGMCLDIKDKYTDSIQDLQLNVDKKSNKTMIEEIVLDLISTIKESKPTLPDMRDPEIFKFYFRLYNKEYNVVFSDYLMKQSNILLTQLQDLLHTPEDNRYWDGSFDHIKHLISELSDEQLQKEYYFKLNTLLHLGKRKRPEDSLMINCFNKKIEEITLEFNDIANSLREELQIPPYIFDLLTRQSLTTDKEINLYKNELNKKKDEFYKKTKKKPLKPDEEEKEINEYKLKLFSLIKEKILQKFDSIEEEKLNYVIESLVMNSYQMDEDYVDRLSRVKCLKNVKNDGLEGKTVILRIDIEEFEIIYENVLNEDEEIVGQNIKEINFPNTKETVLQTMNFLLDNRVKAVVLLCDFGPKMGSYNSNFRMKYFKDFLEREGLIEQSVTFLPELTDLYDLQKKIDSDEVFKDNSLIITENLNFYPEECGFEIENDPLLTTQPGTSEHLKYYSKFNFANLISLRSNEGDLSSSYKNQIFVLDSPRSIMKMYPSVIDMQCEIRCLGMRLEAQIQKLTNFFSIDSPNFMLIIGDIKIQSNNLDDHLNKFNDDQTLLNTLLIINSLLPRFKVIMIMGNLAIIFIQYLQNEYTIDHGHKINPVFNNLIKYILVRADLNNVKIILPQDGILLNKTEFEKFRPGYKFEIQRKNLSDNNVDGLDMDNVNNIETNGNNNEPILIEDYLKYIKQLFKMEKRLKELEALKLDPEELLEHEDYHKNYLTDDQLELLDNYKNNSIKFETEDYRKKFVEIQQIFKPKKIMKNELEIRNNMEDIYRKPIVFPYVNNPSIHNSSNLNNSLSASKVNDTIHKEEENSNNLHNSNRTFINYLFNNEEFELIDWGEKTYNVMTQYFGKMNSVMWLGKLSPTHIENLYDNYAKIIKSFYERKQKLRSEFNELMLEEEKKLHETDLKAKKHLFTIFLKSKSSYDLLRKSFLTFMLPAEDKDSEVPPDEEQFNYEMNLLIDNYITEDFEFVNSILSGKHVPGLFGLSQDPKKEKEVELDLKFLEEIF